MVALSSLGLRLPLIATTEPPGTIPPSSQLLGVLGKVTGCELMPQAPSQHHISEHSVETLAVDAGLEKPPASPVRSCA